MSGGFYEADTPEHRERLERVAAYMRENPGACSGTVARALGMTSSEVNALRRRVVGGRVVKRERPGLRGQYHAGSTALDREARFQTILDDWKRDLERTDGFRKGW